MVRNTSHIYLQSEITYKTLTLLRQQIINYQINFIDNCEITGEGKITLGGQEKN